MKMMKSGFFLIAFMILLFSCFQCYAQSSSGSDLINNAKLYDGKTVVYRGEVIGDIMIRGSHAWVHVNDAGMAIGVWVERLSVRDIRYAGDYRAQGDIVEVSGVFHRSCLEHGGDLDIHAREVKRISPGTYISKPVEAKKIFWGVFLSLVILSVFAVLKLIPRVRSSPEV
jgi:hypothetical protein